MKKIINLLLILISVSIFVACGQKAKVEAINGAGASFPFPFYSEIFEKYYNDTEIRVNYQSIGSGGGVRQITEATVDFGATDAFINDKKLGEIESSTSRKLLHIPAVLGAVSITYNIDGNIDLQLDGDAIAKIFMGKITKWNDPVITSLNPGQNLPNADIIVVRRSDGSGTTFTFSDFLANQNAEWKSEMGVGKSLKWFQGSIGSKGNEGVTGSINQTKNSIGYVSLNYALETGLKVVKVKNNSGNFITPSVKGVSLSAQADLPADTRIALTSVKRTDPNAYPISTFTWIVFYQEQSYNDRPKELAEELKKLLSWMVSEDAQQYAAGLYYAPLPDAARAQALEIIDSITFEGSSL